VYGSTEGSIGALYQLPPLAYRLLDRLQQAMDRSINIDLVQCRRSEFRQVKSSISTASEFTSLFHSRNIIDGDFVESFADQTRSKQLEISKKFSASQSATRGDEQFTNDIVCILEALSKTH